MTTATETQKAASAGVQHELFITRIFDAPRELVWKAFTDPKQMAEWRGPRQFEVSEVEADVRPAGKWRLRLVSEGFDDGTGTIRTADLGQYGEYREVVEPERLVFTYQWDASAEIFTHETVITIEFEEQDGKTLMRFHQAFFELAADRDGHDRGWNSAFDRLDDHLSAGGADESE